MVNCERPCVPLPINLVSMITRQISAFVMCNECFAIWLAKYIFWLVDRIGELVHRHHYQSKPLTDKAAKLITCFPFQIIGNWHIDTDYYSGTIWTFPRIYYNFMDNGYCTTPLHFLYKIVFYRVATSSIKQPRSYRLFTNHSNVVCALCILSIRLRHNITLGRVSHSLFKNFIVEIHRM